MNSKASMIFQSLENEVHVFFYENEFLCKNQNTADIKLHFCVPTTMSYTERYEKVKYSNFV